jgi:hypothetical protein
MSNINLETVIQRTQDILSSVMDEETVLLSIQNSQYYGLRQTGSRVWQLIEKPISLGQIIDILVMEYKVSRTECENDVLEFLDGLQEKNLIRILQ